MKPENRPLSPEWLRRLRDVNAENNSAKARVRREAALDLAKRFSDVSDASDCSDAWSSPFAFSYTAVSRRSWRKST